MFCWMMLIQVIIQFICILIKVHDVSFSLAWLSDIYWRSNLVCTWSRSYLPFLKNVSLKPTFVSYKNCLESFEWCDWYYMVSCAICEKAYTPSRPHTPRVNRFIQNVILGQKSILWKKCLGFQLFKCLNQGSIDLNMKLHFMECSNDIFSFTFFSHTHFFNCHILDLEVISWYMIFSVGLKTHSPTKQW